MDDRKAVLTFRDYGNVRVCLKNLMDSRGMSRNELVRAAKTRFEVVDKWHQGNLEKIDADILARFCYILHGQIEEIFQYEEP